MASQASRPELAAILRRAAHPPIGDVRFWVIQAMVVLIAGVHLVVDMHPTLEMRGFPVGIPVALLIIPVGYAALHYGLSGSGATGVWATLLWLPDLLLPHGRGHSGSDLVDLALVDAVAVFVGSRFELERVIHTRALRASAARLAAEARYRQLFDANRSPILVLDDRGEVTDANPAAFALFGDTVVGRPAHALLGGTQLGLESLNGTVLALQDDHYYRMSLVTLPGDVAQSSRQAILDDVTEERLEGVRATRYAQLVVSADEDQRRRLSRELHDEPLQLFLHLARALESIGEEEAIPPEARRGLSRARDQALEAAVRLRNLATALRPPALDHLGLVPALSSLLAEAEEEAAFATRLEVSGHEARLPPELELGAFRIVQEAVRNATRYAHAEHLRVGVSYGEQELDICIEDDGCGFDQEQLATAVPEHLGLLGMRERAHLLGGELVLRSAPGIGTSVTARLPRDDRGLQT